MAVEAPYSGERIVDPSVLASRIEAISNSVEGAAAHFGSFWFDAPIPAGLDPLSPAYRDAVLAQYRMVAGRDYALQREAHTFDVLHDHDFIARPWPYNTGAAEQVGTMMAALGFVISAIRPRSGHRVLEMGAGWGNLALPLAQMGCNVTALDIEKRYTHILRERSMRTGVDLRVVQAPFLEAGRLFDGERFDLVVFNAAFHHCHDHIALLGLIRDQLLARGGRLVLAGEPLLEALHYPWGLNPSGEGIWAVRTHGWLELVFRPSYLIHALDDCGFDAALTTCEFSPMGNVIVAHRRVTTTLRPGSDL